METLSGERTKAMRPSRGGRLMVTPAIHELLAERVDVVHLIGEVAEIAPLAVFLRIPVEGELQQRRLLLLRHVCVVGRPKEDKRVAALLVFVAAHLLHAELPQ